jgi:hypothetical protein
LVLVRHSLAGRAVERRFFKVGIGEIRVFVHITLSLRRIDAHKCNVFPSNISLYYNNLTVHTRFDVNSFQSYKVVN